jgi:hypothetical protein
MEFAPGDRVELVAINDPYTRLRPGDRGTVTSITDRPEPTIDIQWDNGSTLAILPDAGDLIRPLPSDDADPSPSSPAMPEDPTQPRYPEVQVQLSGQDGNAFALLGRAAGGRGAPGGDRRVLRRGHQRRLRPPAAHHHGLGRLGVAAPPSRPQRPYDVPSGARHRPRPPRHARATVIPY